MPNGIAAASQATGSANHIPKNSIYLGNVNATTALAISSYAPAIIGTNESPIP